MKILIANCIDIKYLFAAVVDDYLSSLKEEALKTNPDFKAFDSKKVKKFSSQNT